MRFKHVTNKRIKIKRNKQPESSSWSKREIFRQKDRQTNWQTYIRHSERYVKGTEQVYCRVTYHKGRLSRRKVCMHCRQGGCYADIQKSGR